MGRALLLTVLATLCLGATAFARDFENPASHDTSQQFTVGANVQRQDTPNDPGYDQAEPDDEDGSTSSNFYDEAFGLFGFASSRTPNALYHDTADGAKNGKPQIAGFNAAGAWKLDRGDPGVAIAILDTGIRWNDTGLRTQIRLNRGELPLPEDASGQTHPGAPQGGYDLNGDGVFNVDDYADDPRPRPHPGRAITAEDLIKSPLSDGVDSDGNGYVDDIAGWDFFNDDNDPNDDSSYFAASNHGTGRANGAAQKGNDGAGSLGVCPHCQIVPLRIWDTFVSDGDTFALGMVYAADNGIQVIEGSNGSLYHSKFAEAASQYAYDKGSVQVFSGDDLNTGNHNYPANYSHTMLIQGVVPDTIGLGSNANEFGFGGFAPGTTFGGVAIGTAAPPSTFFRNANTTQYGGHSSISMEGTTGSENTGKAAGAAGLVISAGLHRPDAAGGRVALTPDEVRETLEQTAEDVLPGDTPGVGAQDPSQQGWDVHFGWGRANLGAAVSLAQSGKLPPQAAIDSPDWYAPVTGSAVHLTGRADAPGPFHYRVEWAPGLEPADADWTTVTEGDSSSAVTDLGIVDLAAVRAAVAAHTVAPDTGGPTFSALSPNPYQQQFTVRLVVTQAGNPTPGVDRRVLTALDDPTLRPGFPKRLGTGGEAPIRYADINGDGVQELLVPLEDGTLHAYEPDGSELPGWPVRTDVLAQASDHTSAPGLEAIGPPLEPLRAPVVADLDGDGTPEIVSSAGRHVYVWEPDGSRRAGFPVSMQLSGDDPHLCTGPQSQPLVHRKCGFLASPALGRLEGPGSALDIVIAGLDGHLYAWNAHGDQLPHFPVDLADPSVPAASRMYAESINNAAIGDLNGDGRDDIVVATNESYGASPAPGDITGGFEQGLADLLASAAGGSSRVYAVDGATGAFLPGWPIKLNGVIQSTLPLIGPGHDASLAKVGGAQRVIVSTTGGSLAEYDTAGTLVTTAKQDDVATGSDVTDRSAQLNLFESAVVGDVTGTGTPDLVKYAVTTGQLANLALAGQNFPYNHTIGAFDAATGAPLPRYPRVTDDYQFLSSSTIAKVDPSSPANQILAGTGLGLLHAYDGATGLDAPGFPKVTGGWLFAPAALSEDGRLADVTREGYLFEWGAPGAAACQGVGRWPGFRHDDHATGNLDADGTAPAAPGAMDLRGRRLTFVAPGDDGRCGTPAKYLAWADGQPIPAPAPDPMPAGGSDAALDVSVPGGTRRLTLAAVDEAGNVGPGASVVVSGPGAGAGNGPAGPAGGRRSATTTTSASGCRDRTPPRSRHVGRVRATRTGLRVAGRATDASRCAGHPGKVRRVRISVMRKAGKRCRPLLENGRFGAPRSCLRTVYLSARGAARWTFARKVRLAPGSYEVWSRAIDASGNLELKARGRNLVRVRVR